MGALTHIHIRTRSQAPNDDLRDVLGAHLALEYQRVRQCQPPVEVCCKRVRVDGLLAPALQEVAIPSTHPATLMAHSYRLSLSC